MYDVAPVASATSSLEGGISSDLAQASSAGTNITVDLAALYAYYNKLVELDGELGRQLQSLALSNPSAPDPQELGSGAPDGVASAFRATRSAREGLAGLYGSVRAIQAQVREHLEALRHNYNNYMAREGETVDRLNRDIPWADKPLGW